MNIRISGNKRSGKANVLMFVAIAAVVLAVGLVIFVVLRPPPKPDDSLYLKLKAELDADRQKYQASLDAMATRLANAPPPKIDLSQLTQILTNFSNFSDGLKDITNRLNELEIAKSKNDVEGAKKTTNGVEETLDKHPPDPSLPPPNTNAPPPDPGHESGGGKNDIIVKALLAGMCAVEPELCPLAAFLGGLGLGDDDIKTIIEGAAKGVASGTPIDDATVASITKVVGNKLGNMSPEDIAKLFPQQGKDASLAARIGEAIEHGPGVTIPQTGQSLIDAIDNAKSSAAEIKTLIDNLRHTTNESQKKWVNAFIMAHLKDTRIQALFAHP